jgi:TfoX/Sxy family transcriptional regulator of competence genes
MSYYQCPEEALESSALMLKWANRGIAAALRAAAKKTLKKERERNPAKT